MATLEKIRNRAGLLVAVVIGLALFAFILGDLLNSGGSLFNQAKMEIAEIAGTSVSYDLYAAKVEENENLQKMFSQTFTLDEQTQMKIREDVWKDLVNQYTLNPQFEKLGLTIHPDELVDMVQGRNIHPLIKQNFSNPNTGIFNKQYLTAFLKSMPNDPKAKTYWLVIEREIQKDRLYSKYINMIAKGLSATSLETKRAVADQFTKTSFQYIVSPYSTIADSLIEINRSDLEEYYDNHRNDYKQSASRDIEYVVFPVIPSDEDNRIAKEWIEKALPELQNAQDQKQYVSLNSDSPLDSKYYKKEELPENLGNWAFKAEIGECYGPTFDGETYKISALVDRKMLPDSVKVRHILISPQGQSKAAYDAAKNLADSLLNVVKRTGKWKELAGKYSNDPSSRDKGGDLGWFREGVMVKNFNDAAFNTPKGKIKLVETQFGFHILQVTQRGKESRKVQLATLERKVVPGSYTDQKIYSEAAEFSGKNRTREAFDKAIEQKGYTKRIASNLLQNDRNIAGLPSPREIIRWAFQADLNDVSKVFKLDDMYVVATVTAIREKGVAPLEQVEQDVRIRVLKEKKAEMLAQSISEKLANASTIYQLADKLNLVTVEKANDVSFSSLTLPAAGIEPEVIGTASVAPKDKLYGPIKGNRGVFVILVTSRTQEQGDNEMVKQRIRTMYAQRAYYDAFNALKEKAEIIDKRYNFY